MTHDSKTFEEIDAKFRGEEGERILADITQVLANHGINGYDVTHVTFTPSQERPDPDLCLPWCIWIPGDGIRCGIWCPSSTLAGKIRE